LGRKKRLGREPEGVLPSHIKKKKKKKKKKKNFGPSTGKLSTKKKVGEKRGRLARNRFFRMGGGGAANGCKDVVKAAGWSL